MNLTKYSINRILENVKNPRLRKFNSPITLIRFLDKSHYNSYEIESILESMWLGEALTEFGDKLGRGNTGTLRKFLEFYDIKPRCSRVNRLVLKDNPDCVADDNGIPCREGRAIMGGCKILVPLGTPLCCDPTSETYASM